jgi:hypothetical protein
MGISTTISSFRNTEFTNGFQPGSYHSIFSFLCSVLKIIVCHYVVFLLVIVLPVLLFTAPGYSFGIFKLSLLMFKIKMKVGAFIY